MISPMTADSRGIQRFVEPLELGTFIDTIPGLVVCALPDGSVEFVNQAWREYMPGPVGHRADVLFSSNQ
jgi:hypothetical protein